MARWVLWLVLMALATAALVGFREDIEQSHAALVLLLLVLGGSAGGGRKLGYVLAVLGFLLIDYFFQAPFGLLSVGKTLDWVVLTAFLASAFVATELLARAKEEADTARERTEEVASLSRLGSATLRYARAEDALDASAALIRATLSARWCTIRKTQTMSGVAERTVAALPDAIAAGQRAALEERIVEAVSRGVRDGEVALATESGVVAIESLESYAGRDTLMAIGLPLYAEARLAGILIVGGDAGAPIIFDAARRRFMATIAYYAALGLERVRLARDAEQAHGLREANRMKDEVLASVSHDLRTPLTTIKLLAQAAANRGDPAATNIEEQADRLARMVTSVLDLSTIRAGSVRFEMELNTAEDLIAAAVSQVQGRLRGRRIITRVDLDQMELIARFDFVQTLRILGNLIENALRYAPEGSEVVVCAWRDGPWLAISVTDRGPGVPFEERTRIFEAFYRPRAQSPDGAASGLGLSIAQRLAELQEGTVTFEPGAEGGSVFTLRLPAVEIDPAVMAE